MHRCRNYPQFGISPAACVMAAMLVLILPLKWIAAAILAAFIHELSHYVAVRLCGGNIQSLHIDKRGAVMYTDALSRWKTIFCVLAGPLGSLFLLLFLRWIPRVAFCGLAHGVYNLLPLHPLDGGKALSCLFDERICNVVGFVFLGAMLAVAVHLSVLLQLGLMPLLVVLPLWKNRPCKGERQQVQ